MRIDFHSHILPGIDDGAADTEESLKLLRMLQKDNVDAVVATPHLYLHKQDVDSFLKAREKSVHKLNEAIKDSGFPQVVIGAEVYFSPGLLDLPLKELCIEGTDYLMLELPYNAFSSTFIRSLANFINASDVNIILAHIERYYDYNKTDVMNEILALDVMAQGNCDSLESMKSRKILLTLIANGKIQLLGTDLHSVKRRPPMFGRAEQLIKKKLSADVFNNMMETAAEILAI